MLIRNKIITVTFSLVNINHDLQNLTPLCIAHKCVIFCELLRMGGDSGWEDEKEMDRVLRELLINMKIIRDTVKIYNFNK